MIGDLAGICSQHPMSGTVSCTSQLYLLPAEGGLPSRLGAAHYTGLGWAYWVESAAGSP